MNDLERDLTQLFHEKADAITTAPGAPEAVLRRGRRRQRAAAVGGGLAALALVAVSFAGVRAVIRGDEGMPADTSGGTRTATIDRFTVTAPAGWTLIDWSALRQYLPAQTTSCTATSGPMTPVPGGGESFTATGSPVAVGDTGGNPDGSTDGSPEGSQTGDQTGEETCTTEPMKLPAGLPILQLSNWDRGLDANNTVCGDVADGRGADQGLEADQAALFVAQGPFDSDLAPGNTDLQEGTGPCGRGMYARFQAGNSEYFVYAGFGPDVTVEDRQALLDANEALHPVGADDEYAQGAAGPGYVIASGDEGTETWQIEVGPVPVNESGDVDLSSQAVTFTVGVMLVRHDSEQHVMGSVTDPWSRDRRTSWVVDGVADTNVLVGMVPAGVMSAVYRASDGSITPLTVAAPPRSLAGVVSSGPFDQNIVWGRVPDQQGELLAGDATSTAAATSTAP